MGFALDGKDGQKQSDKYRPLVVQHVSADTGRPITWSARTELSRLSARARGARRLWIGRAMGRIWGVIPGSNTMSDGAARKCQHPHGAGHHLNAQDQEVFMHQPDDIAKRLLGAPYEALDEAAKKVARHIAARTPIAHNVGEELTARDRPFGQRAADAVASFGGSWTFVGLFAATMLLWVGLNAVLLVRVGTTFDPYPYILLNLFLSMLAAIQAPIILMSQNRQSEKDRVSADHDYEVNLKAELEIMLLHEKIDLLRETQWVELLEIQKRQLELLAGLAKGHIA